MAVACGERQCRNTSPPPQVPRRRSLTCHRFDLVTGCCAAVSFRWQTCRRCGHFESHSCTNTECGTAGPGTMEQNAIYHVMRHAVGNGAETNWVGDHATCASGEPGVCRSVAIAIAP